MRKLSLTFAAALAALSVTSAASASVFVGTATLTPVGPSDGFTSQIVCPADAGSPSRCAFSSTLNFAGPAGYNLQSVTLQTSYTGDLPNVANIDFGTASLNGTFFGSTGAGTPFVTGQLETGALFNQPLLANNTLVVTGLAGLPSGLANADFTGVLSFANTPAVPEPSTWAMMLLGFGAAGYSLRHRKRVTLQAA